MKKVLIAVALFIGMISCNNKPKTEELTRDEIKAKYGIDISPLEEEATKAAGKGGGNSSITKWKVQAATDDLDAETLPDGRDSITVKNIPLDVTFGGVQRSPTNPFTVDGLMSYCNWYKPLPPNKGCSGPHVVNSSYRGWYGTVSGFVKITEVITLP